MEKEYKEGDLLEVGQVLYNHTRWHGLEKVEVVSVSPKQAKCTKGISVKREIKKVGWATISEERPLGVSVIGETFGYLSLPTEKIENEYALQIRENKVNAYFRGIKIESLPVDLKEKIQALIISEQKTE